MENKRYGGSAETREEALDCAMEELKKIFYHLQKTVIEHLESMKMVQHLNIIKDIEKE